MLLIWDITYMLVIFNAFVDIEEKTCEGQLQSPEICLFCSGSGGESIMEPLSAVPLNDELQQAKALVAKAEADVLLKISEKVLLDLST